jgi:WD40 repeat protein
MAQSTVSYCPDRMTLRQLLLGCVTGLEADELESHVAACGVCLREADTLVLDDPLVQAIHTAAMTPPLPQQELIDAVMPLLKRLRLRDATVSMAPQPTTETPLPAVGWLGPPQAPGEVGRLGPYRVLRRLGAGGMGVVYLAEDPELRRQVALKAVRPELVARADMRDQFMSEARAVAAVEHDHIVAIHHVGEHDGVSYLVMPFLRGQTLEERLRTEGGALPIDDILRIGRETAEGLAAAHDHGLVHRDIKPSNLFLERNGRVKILDFGLAQVRRDEEAGLLPTGAVAGTPGYMSPEQGRGEHAGAASDLFSLGCVLYRMATGRGPFQGTDAVSLLLRVAVDVPPSPASLNPKLPASLAELIERLLAKRPADRPTSAHEVAEMLRAIERERAQRHSWAWRHRWLLGAAALLAAAGLALWLPRWGPVTTDVVPPNQASPTQPAREVKQHQRHSLPVRAVTMSPVAGSLLVLSAGDDSQVVAWDAGTDDEPWTLGNHRSPVHCVAISGDGQRAASGGGGKAGKPDFAVRLWDLDCRQRLAMLAEHESWVTAVAFGPEGTQLLSGGADGSLCLWDVKTRKVIHKLRGHDTVRIAAVAFAPDGKQALSGGGDEVILLWDVAAGQFERRLEGHSKAVTSAVYAPDGAHIASAGLDGTIRVWDLAAGTHRVIQADKEGVHSIAWSRDGEYLLSGGADGMVRLWDADRLTEVACLKGHRDRVHSVAFSAGGRHAVSGGADCTVRLWELPK